MSTWLTRFLTQTQRAEPWQGEEGTLYMLIDSVRQPRVEEQLFQLSEDVEIKPLFQGTAFAELNDVSPLWVHLPAGGAMAAKAAQLCLDNRSGILLTSTADAQSSLAHARRLLQMRSAEYGLALARFYDPAFWSALALTVPTPALFGPWETVFTPPANPSDSGWRVWQREEQDQEDLADTGYPLSLQASTLAAVDELRWWYWVRALEAEASKALADAQLPLVLSNLCLLIEHGIEEGRHLQSLLPHLQQQLSERPEVMEMLRRDLPAFEKAQRLEGLV
ncbi:DUF4123 domain-containing protein [Pseudomonas sp.]|jgi:hypothetical protein|uniref:DUF4123 domain-containing protein n=1 Tax=Pseudomonas sp. TaxID=306 RepID=UPI0039822F8F